MRLIFTLSFFLLVGSTQAQDLTGIWRGYFSSSNGISREVSRPEMYKYEIQIDQQSNNGLRGVTYSYKSTVFYGKAEVQGILSLPSKSMILKETRLVDLKIGDKSEPCLMTCYLDYLKMGKLEVLEGTFISVNVKDKGDCGSGKVYLERVSTSDFKTEDFLLKKLADSNAKVKPQEEKKFVPKVSTPATKKSSPNSNEGKNNPVKSAPTLSKKTTSSPTIKKQPTTKPLVKARTDHKIEKEMERQDASIPEKTISTNKEAIETLPQSEVIKKLPIPRVIRERENNLVRTIYTSEENIQIDLYDNGTIDNDSISVYDNNQLLISEGRLSYTPIRINIKCNKVFDLHEIVVVAENLGDIPPNTALMVVMAGKERHEIFLASTEKRNAKVIIKYKPKE